MVGGDETVIVVVCSLAIIAAGTPSIQSPAVATAAHITYYLAPQAAILFLRKKLLAPNKLLQKLHQTSNLALAN